MDTHTLTGTKWRNEIKQQLAQARTVVALWSAAAEESDYVMDEAEDAKKRGILVPALIESMQLPYGFRQIQTANMIGWNGEEDHPGLQQLVAALRVHLKNGDEVEVSQTRTATTAPTSDATAPPREQRSPPPASGAKARADHADRAVGKVPMLVPAAGQTFRDKLKVGGEGPLMVVIPAGRFLMGSPPKEPDRADDEGPQHEVTIAHPFALGVYAVTFDEYERYTVDTKVDKPDDNGWGRGKRPIINVSWKDAQAYCAWLSLQTGLRYRLPSEAEWEYACRAGTTTPFHFGERLRTDQANFDGNFTYNGSTKDEYRAKTVPVGSFAPNDFGLHDMHGNVWEWCEDTWHDNYRGAPADGSVWESRARRVPCAARRGVVRRSGGLPRGLPLLRPPGLPRLRHRFPCVSWGPHRNAGCCVADHGIAEPLNTERRAVALARFF